MFLLTESLLTSLPCSKKETYSRSPNYRPVSLISLCCKLREHIITSNIMAHLEQHKILTNCQHSFRARRTCEIQLLTLVHELAQTADKGGQTDLVILDFSKASDRVPHKKLSGKLDHCGIRCQTHTWIKSFLTRRTQQVIVGSVWRVGNNMGHAIPPDQCNLFRVTKMRSPPSVFTNWKDNNLKSWYFQVLGVNLPSNLQWKDHIDRTVKKANSTTSFLWGSLRVRKHDTKSAAYFTFVPAHIKYCASVWNPNTAQS